MNPILTPKKLIEVALPLDAIAARSGLRQAGQRRVV